MMIRSKELIQKMLLTLTWCHSTPRETPARSCKKGASNELKLDNVASAYYGGRKAVATAPLKQGRLVQLVPDCQVVPPTCGMGLNVKCSEM